ncbi:MAG: class I SAM-dependent rRNA methyltransferase, partial [Clostridia bacterium]|nr:class I SAM-dependent rRNA methyltransferase [Clostridia bacterium]
MKTQRAFPAFTVSEKAELSLRAGHPWVYAEEFVKTPAVCENGALADVFSQKGAYLGTGFFSEKSKIGVRVLSSNANETYGAEFWRRRVKYALDYRLAVMGKTDFRCCRLIFGEADGMPGLTVDRFENVLVSQVLSYGMEQIKPLIYSLLCELLAQMGYPVEGVYERNDVAIRELEGLPQYKGWYGSVPHPSSTVALITENGIKYEVDFENGQKTGFFLDQKYSRLALSKLCEGRRVLDCFTHTGSFALNAVKGGAEHVTA